MLCFRISKLLIGSIRPRIVADKKAHGAIVQAINTSFFSHGIIGLISIDAAAKSTAPLKPSLNNLMEQDDTKVISATEEDEERKKQRETSWRTMKLTLICFGLTMTIGGGFVLFELGKPRRDEEGNLVTDEFSDLPTFQQIVYRTLKELNYYKRMIKEPSRDKLLPDPVSFPYIQPEYTLVLELTDVLVHPEWTYNTGWRFKKRPGLDTFLESLYGKYEIVIYTSEQGMTVFPIVEALDPKNYISYKLVRDATHFENGRHMKNLTRLNRDLQKVIVIDWDSQRVERPENLFHIDRWNGTDHDITLIDLAAFLTTVATSEIKDVREVLNYYKQFPNPLAVFRERETMLLKQKHEEEKAKSAEVPPPVKRWNSSFLKRSF